MELKEPIFPDFNKPSRELKAECNAFLLNFALSPGFSDSMMIPLPSKSPRKNLGCLPHSSFSLTHPHIQLSSPEEFANLSLPLNSVTVLVRSC